MKANAIIYILGGILAAMMLMVSAISGGGNELGTVVKYISVGALIFAFVRPRVGFWISLFCIGYIDFLKRLLVLGGNFNFLDVTNLLAFPPFLSVITFAGVLTKQIFSRSLTRQDAKLLGVWFILSCALGVFGLSSGVKGLGLLQSIANFIGYIPLIYIIPYIFKTNYEIIKTLKTMVLMFLPVAFYGLYQKYAGFADFELDYLATGYSIEYRILAGQDFRYFSTLNSSQNLCKFASMIGVMALLLCTRYRGDGKELKVFSPYIKIIFYLLFAFVGVLSGARTGIVMGLFAIPAYFVFKSRILTFCSYISGILGFIGVIFTSEYVINNNLLTEWTKWLERHIPEWLPLRPNLGTYTIRLEGFSHWKKLDFWRPFGFLFSDEDYALLFPHHDTFTSIILKFGYIPLGVAGIAGSVLLLRFHRIITVKNRYDNSLYLCLALAACILFGCLSTSNLSTYPINLMLYMFLGFAIVNIRNGSLPEPV